MLDEKGKKGLEASVKGFAHEHIVVGLLMKKYQNVSLVDLPLSPYDIIVVLKNEKGEENIIRAQVKTVSGKAVHFTGGTRGGIDRSYKSGVKEYTQSTHTSDVVIGILAKKDESFDLYFIPTVLIEKIKQKSISISKIEFLKNNYDILENCQNKPYILQKTQEFNFLL
jgi:hypothetical protein